MNVLASFQISNLNPRREKAGEDDGDLACDIKLSAELTADAVSGFFSTDSARARLLDDLWTSDGELATTDLDKFYLTTHIKGGKATIKSEMGTPEHFEGVDLNKITLKPKASRMVEVSMRLQVHPTCEQMGRLAELLGCEVMIVVERSQAEMELQPPGDEDEKENVEVQDEIPIEVEAVVPGQKPPQRPKRAKEMSLQ